MRFDFTSFLIGFVSASVLALILWRSRRQISAVQQQVEQQAGAARKFITNSAEQRYYDSTVKMLNAYHVAGDVVRLTDIYVEPSFLKAAGPVDPTGEKPPTVFHVVPIDHDLPASYAPYNLETVSINELQSGERHLALLGLPGAGKSTALAIIGLVAAGEIEIPVIDTMVDEYFEEELKKLTPEQQARERQTREDIQQRALEQLRRSQKKGDFEDVERAMIDFRDYLPILVHLREIDLRPETYGVRSVDSQNGRRSSVQLDPAEPLVMALQARFGGVTASTLPRIVYDRLTNGTALVLIDGYDDIPAAQRPEKLLWLRHFIEVYRANIIIVAGPESGYDPLLNLGLSPCFLRAWSDGDYQQLIDRWVAMWPTIGGKKGRRGSAGLPEEKLVRRVATANRGRVPLDVTLKIWAAFSGDEQEQGRRGWYDFYVRRSLPNENRPLIQKIAAMILDGGGAPLSREQMKIALAGPDGKLPTNADETLNKLLGRTSLLVEWPGGLYGFNHGLINAYLAAETLTAESVVGAADKPAWALAMQFAAIRLPMDAVVAGRLAAPPDLLYSGLFSMAYWLPDAPGNAPWKAEIFKRLGAALLMPSQFPLLRERALSALVISRDKGILYVLRQALKNANPHVRLLGCIGLGALGDSEAIKDLQPMLIDPDSDVQLAAGIALGAIGTDTALDTMLNGLAEGDKTLRRAVAEALAAIPGVGHSTLREAIADSDIEMRYAAVFGLARIKAGWALSTLYRTLLEDAEWYVRNAAEEAFKQVEQPGRGGIERHPEADRLDWLIAWAAERGEGVPAGQNSRQVLIRVLQEADAERRAAAALTLGRLGYVHALKPLYGALRDRDEKVRAAAHEALGSLQTRLGEPLPAVV